MILKLKAVISDDRNIGNIIENRSMNFAGFGFFFDMLRDYELTGRTVLLYQFKGGGDEKNDNNWERIEIEKGSPNVT